MCNTNISSSPSHLSHLSLSSPFPLLPFSPFPDTALSFEFSSYTVNESQPILPVNIVKEPRNAETEIRYQFSVMATDVTATESGKQCLPTTGGIDFNASNLTGVFVGSQSILTLSVPVVNDDLDEGGRGE